MSLIDNLLAKQHQALSKATELEREIVSKMVDGGAWNTLPFSASLAGGQGQVTFRLLGPVDPGSWARLDLEMLVIVPVSSNVVSSGKLINAGRPTFNPVPLRWDVVTDERIRADIFGLLLREEASN
jgi:hypothetical protein